jgi:hypothetical protein
MPTTRTPSRRRQVRYDVSDAASAFVEFAHPPPNGPHLRLSLVDIGVSGIRFAYGEELSGLEVGSSVAPVTIHIGDCQMHGELVVMHLTPVSDAIVHCGALFYPSSDEELIKLKSVVAGLAAAGSV